MIHTAWGITEVTRYLYYFLHIDMREPYILTWLRYSLFIFLYPTGTAGELLVVTAARFDLAAHTYENIATLTLTHSTHVLGLTLSLDILRYVAYIIYPPSLYYLYTYMLKQRKKELGKMKVIRKRE